jgi:hypothetical protein
MFAGIAGVDGDLEGEFGGLDIDDNAGGGIFCVHCARWRWYWVMLLLSADGGDGIGSCSCCLRMAAMVLGHAPVVCGWWRSHWGHAVSACSRMPTEVSTESNLDSG